LADLDAVEERVESHRTRGVSADQVSLDRGVSRSVELYAADRDAVACRVDDVAGAGRTATNCNSGTYFHIDASR
jgi:hypothetical protein